MKRKFVCFFLFVLLCLSMLDAVSLKLVKEIGNNDDDNYLFVLVTGAVVSPNKDIFVIDSKLNHIAKYDWSGKFLKKLGKTGQGPNEIDVPLNLQVYKDKLYFIDYRNRRIVITNFNLDKLDFLKLQVNLAPSSNFFVLNENSFMCENQGINLLDTEDPNGITVIDKEGLPVYSFFEHKPFCFPEKKKEHPIIAYRKKRAATPKFAINRDMSTMLISFATPDNPVKFYKYTLDGKYLGEFEYALDEKFRYPYYKLNSARWDYPGVTYQPWIYDVIYYNKHYIVHLNLTEQKKKSFTNKWMRLLVFEDKSNKLVGELEMPEDFRLLHISGDGYLLGTRLEQEVIKILIYKFEL